MNTKTYFLWQNEKENGPFEEASLREAINAGTLSPMILARTDSDVDWSPLGQLLPRPIAVEPSQSRISPAISRQLKRISLVLLLGALGAGAFKSEPFQSYLNDVREKEIQKEKRQEGIKLRQSRAAGNAIAKEAIQEFSKLNSAIEAGVNYQSYSQRVVDTKVRIDEILSRMPDGSSKADLQQAMLAFLVAREFWGYCIEHDEGFDIAYFDDEQQERYIPFGVQFTKAQNGNGRGVGSKDDVRQIWEFAETKIGSASYIIAVDAAGAERDGE